MPSQLINNRHIIDDALNVLSTALSSFVASKTGVIAHTDVSALLGNMLSRWDDAFHAALGYRGKNLVYEIRDIRNDWAHYTKSFDDDDTDRALDSIERLLVAIGAATEATQVKRMKEEHRRLRYQSPETSSPVSQAATSTQEHSRLRNQFSQPPPAQRQPASNWPRSISIRQNLIGRGVIRHFGFNGVRYEIPHDELVQIVGEVTPWLRSPSWVDMGGYSTSNPFKALLDRLRPFALNFSD